MPLSRANPNAMALLEPNSRVAKIGSDCFDRESNTGPSDISENFSLTLSQLSYQSRHFALRRRLQVKDMK